ncbi:Protein kinase alk2 [Boothiomyces sp. JEL0866]|nr:Protein kinase alk2 [Boothiomyces sp. JEL0866]
MSKKSERIKDYYYVAAGAVGLVSALCWYFRNDAVGTKRIDSKVQRSVFLISRAKTHLPLVGTTFSFLGNMHRMSDYISDEVLDPEFTGAKVFSNMFMEPVILINDPESLEYVMNTNFENYVKGTMWGSRVTDFLGHGIFNSDGQEWYMQRKLASKIFTARAFKANIETVFASNIQTFLKVIKDKNDQPIDLHDMFHRFFMDSFGEIAFGIEIHSLTRDQVPFAQAFDRIQKVTSQRFFNPFFNITDRIMYPNVKEDIKLIREFGLKVINDRRQEANTPRNDLLSLFMNYTNEDGTKLTDDQLIDHVLNFLIAGRDTTAQGLSWTFYSLFKNPKALEALLTEIDTSLKDQLIPDYDTVKKMKYANAVFKEGIPTLTLALRLYPSVSREAKLAVHDDVLPNGTPVPAGTALAFSPYAYGRNSKVWSDPLEFKPERWMTGKQPTQYEYPSFNCGPRICLGKTLAEIQGVFVMVSTLARFHFKIENMDMVVPGCSLTFPMKHGMQVRFYDK